jgi:hypothetical protein
MFENEMCDLTRFILTVWRGRNNNKKIEKKKGEKSPSWMHQIIVGISYFIVRDIFIVCYLEVPDSIIGTFTSKFVLSGLGLKWSPSRLAAVTYSLD